jgi:hypothetical protein
MSDCPDVEYGPYHMWESDGPHTVTCVQCGLDGVITETPDE